MRKTKSFRIEETLIEEAYEKGLDLNLIVEASIAKVLNDKKCPYCNQQVKSKKRKTKKTN